SRACSSGIRLASGTFPGALPFGCRERTRSRISWKTVVSSSVDSSTLLAPARRDFAIHAATRCELADYRRRDRLAGFYHLAQKTVYGILLENTQISITNHVHFERLQLQAKLVGHVA